MDELWAFSGRGEEQDCKHARVLGRGAVENKAMNFLVFQLALGCCSHQCPNIKWSKTRAPSNGKPDPKHKTTRMMDPSIGMQSPANESRKASWKHSNARKPQIQNHSRLSQFAGKSLSLMSWLPRALPRSQVASGCCPSV